MGNPDPNKPTNNLQPMKLPALGQPEQDQELQQLYAAVVAKTEEAIRWYSRNKSKHKRRAVILRGVAITLAGCASILPIVVSMFPREWEPARWVPLASILAALSASCVGFDRLYGYSANWMRSLHAFLDLQAQLEQLQFSWTRRALETRLVGGSRSDNLTVSLNLLQSTLVSVNQALKTETLEWASNFSVALQEFEKSVVAQRAAAPALPAPGMPTQGALKLQIAEFETLDDHRCEIKLGVSATAETHTSSTKAYTDLLPGQHLLRVAAKRGGRPVSTEDVVIIEPGKTTAISVTLA